MQLSDNRWTDVCLYCYATQGQVIGNELERIAVDNASCGEKKSRQNDEVDNSKQ